MSFSTTSTSDFLCLRLNWRLLLPRMLFSPPTPPPEVAGASAEPGLLPSLLDRPAASTLELCLAELEDLEDRRRRGCCFCWEDVCWKESWLRQLFINVNCLPNTQKQQSLDAYIHSITELIHPSIHPSPNLTNPLSIVHR